MYYFELLEVVGIPTSKLSSTVGILQYVVSQEERFFEVDTMDTGSTRNRSNKGCGSGVATVARVLELRVKAAMGPQLGVSILF